MSYEEFRGKILAELKGFYEKDAEVSIRLQGRTDQEKQEWLEILLADSENRVVPRICLEKLYRLCTERNLDVSDCVGMVVEIRDSIEQSNKLIDHINRVLDWETIKDNVYPIILDEEKDQENRQMLVLDRFLDLTVGYILRADIGKEWIGCCEISKALLKHYGITKEQLQEQALRNLEHEGYRFCDLADFMSEDLDNIPPIKEVKSGRVYILTNELRTYGAAGILHTKLLKEVLGAKSCFIVIYSDDEVAFIPDAKTTDQKKLDEILQEINAFVEGNEGLLVSHSYYYDGTKGEIRIHKQL